MTSLYTLVVLNNTYEANVFRLRLYISYTDKGTALLIPTAVFELGRFQKWVSKIESRHVVVPKSVFMVR